MNPAKSPKSMDSTMNVSGNMDQGMYGDIVVMSLIIWRWGLLWTEGCFVFMGG
jgi:hypothetical protein